MMFAALTVQNLLEEQSRNPSPSLEERIESAKRRANQVRVKFQQDVVRFVLNLFHCSLFISHFSYFAYLSDKPQWTRSASMCVFSGLVHNKSKLAMFLLCIW